MLNGVDEHKGMTEYRGVEYTFEAAGPEPPHTVITLVASVEDFEDGLGEWEVYWCAFPLETEGCKDHPPEVAEKMRMEYTARFGIKVPEAVAVAFFPDVVRLYRR